MAAARQVISCWSRWNRNDFVLRPCWMKKLVQMLCGFCLAFAFQANAPAQPIITNQPQSITVNNASIAMFTVRASNATSYQWYFNGTNNLGDGTNLNDGVIISGSATSALTLEDVTTNEAGIYTVAVSGLTNSVTSSNAILTITNGTIVTFTLSGLLTNARGSNVQVQLFDHDKPATVQNFLHYIRSGAYTNMFFDRCDPGFVLQGGDDGATDRTKTNSPITGWDIPNFTASNQFIPPFPAQVDSEFNVGPLIHNRFGTLAMALESSESGETETNSATSAFFFNLVDNSAYLDSLGFTVFGRILNNSNEMASSNALAYFNTLSNGYGAVAPAAFSDYGNLTTIPSLNLLPVNYEGSNAPANSNLVFCGFSFQTTPPVDTNLPTVSTTSPAPNAVLTNGNPTIQGTASDDVGLAVVICVLIPRAAADGTYPNGGVSITNYAVGTTNWSVNFTNSADPYGLGLVPPGSYILSVQSQDGAGNLSTAATQPLIITAIITNGSGTVTLTNGVFSNLDAVGYPFQNGSNYNVMAKAGTNQVFLNWSYEGQIVAVGPGLLLPMSDGLVVTVMFITNGIPNSIAFTYPPANAIISTNTFNITGTISNAPATPLTVTCYIYSTTTYEQADDSPLTNSGTTNWSVTVSNLLPDSYSVEAMAVDTNGNSTAISENFSVGVPLQLDIVGPGTVSGATNGEPILIGTTFTVTAIPMPGQLFHTWSNSASGEVSLNPVQTYTMAAGLTLTATFISNTLPNMIAFTYPKANSIIGTNSFYITGTISNVLSTPVIVTCQIFSNSTALAFNRPLEANGTNNWSIGVSGLGVGSYTLVATASDLAGDSTLISEDFTVQYSGALQLIIVGKGTVSPVTNGEMLALGANFEVTATPASGQVFYTWNNGTQISANATQTYTMASGLTLTATFIPSNTAKGISFTYPAANARLSTNTFPLRGRIATGFKPAVITCQIFQTNGLAIGTPLTTSGKTTWAAIVTNLPGGYYTVEAAATNPAGMSTIISENFSVLPFAATTGTYSGLFISTNSPVAPTNSGFLTFTLTPFGTFSGKLVFPAYPAIPIYSLSFENIDFTTGYVPFGFTNFHGEPLSGAIYLDLSGGTDVALGTISSDAWSSQLICHRAVTKLSTNTTPATGKYILSLQPENQTNKLSTNGYAALVIARGGAMALSGALPDDTTFSQSVMVSKDGVWPLYVIPTGYKTNGMLMGWETNSASGDCSGQLYWYKAPHIGAYYTGGVGAVSNMLVNSTGTNYSRPAAGSQYSIIFEGGTIVPPLTNTLMVNEAGQFAVSGSPPDKLKISLSANGVITGSVLNTNDHKTLRFKGAFVSPSQGGSGFIPDAGGQTGCFELELDPQ
jgi:cyclophilin family peptidyl-prolyl cis-trans isomerase